MVSLVREKEIRRLIDGRLREFAILDIRRADPAVFAVPWVPDLTPEERTGSTTTPAPHSVPKSLVGRRHRTVEVLYIDPHRRKRRLGN